MFTNLKLCLSLDCGVMGEIFLNFYNYYVFFVHLRLFTKNEINCFNYFLSVKYWQCFDIKVVKQFSWGYTRKWGIAYILQWALNVSHKNFSCCGSVLVMFKSRLCVLTMWDPSGLVSYFLSLPVIKFINKIWFDKKNRDYI